MKYTKEYLIDELHRFYEEYQHTPSTKDLTKGFPSEGIYRRTFGSWDEACKAAGFFSKSRISNEENYNQHPKKCLCCGKEILYELRRNIYCSHSCSAIITNTKKRREVIKLKICNVSFKVCEVTGKVYCNKDRNGRLRRISPYILTEKELYYRQASFCFDVMKYPNDFDLELLKEYGWYTCPGGKSNHSPANPNGVSRDHILSVSEGFMNGYDPINIGHPANCRIIKHIENKAKDRKSDITYDELLERIKEWDDRHKKALD